jgi:hypothetical protein
MALVEWEPCIPLWRDDEYPAACPAFPIITEAILFVKKTVGNLQWQQADATFFPNIELGNFH